MSDQLDRLEQLFHEALELRSARERADYLARACGNDTALRDRLEKLLRAHSTAGQFLSPDAPVSTVLPESDMDFASTEKPGDQFGQYTLVERIGEGGCCVVYLAEQVTPIRRHVALKLIKAGMDTRQVVARFETERQALALMDHPNIAKVFEAGVTAAGRPYFVMELVRGLPINQFCDANQLSIKQRLELFMQVAYAVQHAHQKGIIHRDLKPSNILVTTADSDSGGSLAPASDAQGEDFPEVATGHFSSAAQSATSRHQPLPKIIDFGIAKAVQPGLTGSELVTWFGQFVGTPAYMSPEQAGMRNEDIDARSDIYSLGALLYELLTGVTPFDSATLATAAFDEILRRIQETDPPKPSVCLAGLGEKLAGLAEARRADPVAWRRSLQGDLDWIVMKALEKDRQRRYATANDLAEDIHRHLEHEPVQAGPPGAGYRARKFVRRHQVGVAVAISVALALVAGLSLALVGLHRALRAEAVTRQQRDRAVQAEADARRMLELFSDKLVADDELIGLLQTAARLARESLGPTNPATLKLLLPLGPNLARLGAWTNALESYLALVEAEPGNSDHWQCAHAAALAAGQAEVTHRLHQGMAERFASSQEWTDQLRVAKALLLPPDDPAHLETAGGCARQCIQARPGDASCQTVMGMAEYRRGNWSEALKWLQQAERSQDPNVLALAHCFGAMVRQRLGQPTDALEALTRASRQLRLPLETGQLLARDWQEVVSGFIARAEAERIIWGQEMSPRVTPQLLAHAREKWKSVREPLVHGEGFARQGKWEESRDSFVQALQHPSFDWGAAEEASPMRCLSLHMSIVFARTGDSANQQRLCRLLLNLHPENPTTPKAERDVTVKTERYAKVCFLYPQALPPNLLQEALKLARIAVTNQQLRTDHHAGWTRQTGGMAELFAGDPEQARAWLADAERDESELLRGSTMAYRAMLLKKQNRTEEAAKVLQEAENLFRNSPEIQTGLYWWSVEMYRLALEQARQMIDGETK